MEAVVQLKWTLHVSSFWNRGEGSHCPGQDVLSSWWRWRSRMRRANQWSIFKLPSRQGMLHRSPQDEERLSSAAGQCGKVRRNP